METETETRSEAQPMSEIPNRADFLLAQDGHNESDNGTNLNFSRAMGLAWQSYNIGRSTNSSTVLLLGLSGAGKSHTINNFFDQNVAPVGDSRSVTEDIVEFTIDMACDSIGILNSNLHVIDTPGFADTTKGIEYDAKVLGTIKNLFTTKGYTPNFILLALNFNDTRLEGGTSDFVKLLRAMKLQLLGTVLDIHHPNLIVVLTHLCGALPRHRREPGAKMALVRQLVLENLGIVNVPIEVAENCAEDYDLPKEGDYHKLPNGDLYPRNIYQTMVQLGKSFDPIGYGIINEAYPKLREQRNEILETKFPIQHVEGLEEIVRQILAVQISASSEIYDRLQQSSDQFKGRWTPAELALKMGVLGYKELTDLPITNKDKMSFFNKLNADPLMAKWITSTFNISPPHFAKDFLVGRAFRMTMDEVMSTCLLEPGSSDLSKSSLSNIGCLTPEWVTMVHCPELEFTFNVYKSQEDLTRARLERLKIHMGAQNSTLKFNFGLRDGYNVVQEGQSSDLTAVYEQRLIRVERLPCQPLNPEFEQAILQLPSEYDMSSAMNVTAWSNFFNTYGTHYIKSSFLGGSIIFKIKNVNPALHSSSFHDLITNIISSVHVSDRNRKRDLSITIEGGNSSKANDLVNARSVTEFMKYLKEWEESILDNPAVSLGSISLGEITKIVHIIRPNITTVMNDVIFDLYGAQLELEGQGQGHIIEPPTRRADSKLNNFQMAAVSSSLFLVFAGLATASLSPIGAALIIAGNVLAFASNTGVMQNVAKSTVNVGFKMAAGARNVAQNAAEFLSQEENYEPIKEIIPVVAHAAIQGLQAGRGGAAGAVIAQAISRNENVVGAVEAAIAAGAQAAAQGGQLKTVMAAAVEAGLLRAGNGSENINTQDIELVPLNNDNDNLD